MCIFTEAFGQTACPAGVAPGSPQCGPDSGTSRGDIPTPPPRPTGEWIKTWGAVATSGSGDAGVSSGRRTKEQAENDAIASCEGLGSGSCRVSMAFFNQCVAAADSGQGQGSMFSAASIEEASRSAIKQCEKIQGVIAKLHYQNVPIQYLKGIRVYCEIYINNILR